MRDILHGITLAVAIVCSSAIAGAQQPAPDAQKQGQGKGVAPSDEQAVGPPEAEAGQQDSRNLRGDPRINPEGQDAREVPGATAETLPAKFSPEIAAQDAVPMMQRPVLLSDEQKRAVWQAVADRGATARAPGERVFAETGAFLPIGMEPDTLPEALLAQVPALHDLKYVKVDDKVLLVAPANNIVRGVVEE